MQEDEAIKRSFEVLGMSPEEIAVDRELEVVAVKAKLLEVSSSYRKACKLEPLEEDKLNFSDRQLEEVNDVIFQAATTATDSDGNIDWRVRSENARYIRDDKKGRKEVAKLLAHNTFNVLQLNESLAGAREKAAKAVREMVEV